MSTDIRSNLIEQGWKQGTIICNIKEDSFQQFAHWDINNNGVYLIISQTCDLINPSFQNEPFFEVIQLVQIEASPSNEYTGGKNSREIQLEFEFHGELTTFQALPYKRFFVDRQLLAKLEPDSYLPDNIKDMLVIWLAKRLSRTAFPDAFDQRWKARRKQIETIIKKLKSINNIYIKIDPFDEAGNDTEYKVDIYLLMDAELYDDLEILDEYNKYKQSLEDQFNQCESIDLQSIEIISDADITLREIQEFKRWDYSYLSYREPENHVLPPVGD